MPAANKIGIMPRMKNVIKPSSLTGLLLQYIFLSKLFLVNLFIREKMVNCFFPELKEISPFFRIAILFFAFSILKIQISF